MNDEAFFERDGALFVPTGIGVSPWNGQSQSGVAIAALFAHLFDGTPAPVPMHPSRITLDLLGAVPMRPLAGTVGIVREGRRVQLVEAELAIDGRVWARATVLRVRVDETPATAPPAPSPPPIPVAGVSTRRLPWLELRTSGRAPDHVGPGALWVRFPGAAVAGVPLSPLARALMAADFGAGAGPPLPASDWSLANLDITLHLTRLPVGEWLLVEGESRGAGNGVAVARATLTDERGPFGSSAQTVFLDRRRR